MNTATAPFGEVLTAIITPFDSAGAVDYGTFWRLCRHLAANGNDGLVVCGTTGESPTLSYVEKVALFRAAVDAVGGRAAVVAGVGTYDTKESVELAEQAAEAGCDGLMAVTPYYSRPPQEGLYRHFVAIADATELPLMVYNIPGRTARLIEIDTLVRLAEHPRIVAIKDAVDDLDWSSKQLSELPEDMAVYSGTDSVTLGLMSHGAVGVVSVAAHVAGNQIKRMVRAMHDGDVDEAHRIDEALQPLNAALFVEPSPMPVRAALSMTWDEVGDPRLPLVPASEATRAQLADALASIDAV